MLSNNGDSTLFVVNIATIILSYDFFLSLTLSDLLLNYLHDGCLVDKPCAAVDVQKESLHCIFSHQIKSRPSWERFIFYLDHVISEVEFRKFSNLHVILLSQTMFENRIEIRLDVWHERYNFRGLLLVEINMLLKSELEFMLTFIGESFQFKHFITNKSTIKSVEF